MTSARAILAAFAFSTIASAAHAASITLNGLTTPIAVNAQIRRAPEPIASGVGNTVASGQIWTGGEGQKAELGDKFVAWCFDLIHPVSLGATYDYEVVESPFSNSYLLDGADTRVSNLFNANYSFLEIANEIQAAAFQLAVWEVANDDDYDLEDGVFQGRGRGKGASEITATAQEFLLNGEQFRGPLSWQPIFLETREARGTQNLVTAVEVSSVPLPAAGFLLIGGLASLAAFRRRKSR